MNPDYSSDSTIEGSGTWMSLEKHRAELRALDNRRWEEMQAQRKAHEESVDQLRAKHGRELTERDRLLDATNQRLSASEYELKQATIAAKQRAADLALQTSFRINELEGSAASARRERDLSRSNLNHEIRKGLKSNSDLHAKLSKATLPLTRLKTRIDCSARPMMKPLSN